MRFSLETANRLGCHAQVPTWNKELVDETSDT